MPHPVLRTSLISLAVALASSTAWADGASNAQAQAQAAIEARLQQLESELSTLRTQLADDQAQQQATNAKLAAATPAPSSSLSPDLDAIQKSLQWHALVQFDGRFFPANDASGVSDTFTFRRVEPSLQGRLSPWFSFVIMPEFGGSPTSSVTADIYGNFEIDREKAVVRVGKFKEPFGLENLQGAGNTAFNERGYPTNLSPNRSLGLQLGGKLNNKTIEYAAGLFNGAPDGGDAAPSDTENHKEVAGRLFFKPWKNTDSALAGLGFGIAGTIAHENSKATSSGSGATATSGSPGIAGTNGILGQYKSPGQNTIFQYGINGAAVKTVNADGTHTRWSPQLNYYNGPFSLLAEYVDSRQGLSNGTQVLSLNNTAHEVTVGYVLTGEKAAYDGVKVNRPVGKGGHGAVEVVARSGEIDFDSRAFTQQFADPKASVRRAISNGIGVNWYLNNNVKLALDYEYTQFTGGAKSSTGTVADRPSENAILLRSQYTF